MIATVLVNGAAIQTIVLSPPQPVSQGGGSDGKEPDPEPPKEYFLNIMTQEQRTELKVDGKDTLWVYAQVTCSDPKVDADSLTSAVQFRVGGPNAEWLVVGEPTMAGSYMAIQLQAAPPSPQAQPVPGNPQVTAFAHLEGKLVSGSVGIAISNEVELQAWVSGKKEASARFDRQKKEWVLPDIAVYFSRPGEEEPVKPPFEYGFPEPPFETAPPDLLSLEQTTRNDTGLVYYFQVKIKDPEALVQYFGPALDQNGGKIEVKITAIDDQQKSYTATVAYSLAPELVMLAWGFEEDSRVRADKRTYREAEFGEFEFVSDAQDELNLAVIFVRSDQLEEGQDDPTYYLDQAADFCRIASAQLTGTGADKYELTPPDAEAEGSAVYEFKVKSTQGEMATAASNALKLGLAIRAQATGQAARQYGSAQIGGTVALKPLMVFLKLLVVPGDCQGTSLAVAYAGTAPGTPRPLREVPLVLDSKALGSGPQLVPRETQKPTNDAGVATFVMDYRGMSWKAMGEARFRVRCAIKPPDAEPVEGTYCDIDVNANGAAYIDALTRSAGQLELSNPNWAGTSKLKDYLWPDSLTGPLNNICSLAAGGPQYEHYTCGQLRERIWGFSIGRRFSRDAAMAAGMNGLDFGKYEIAPIHVYFGLFPAGNEDPYFIDPWWDQAFNPDKVLLTYTSETTKLCACVALLCAGGAAALVAMGKVATLAAAGALIKSWLTYGVIAGTYGTLEATYHYLGYGFHIGKTPIEGEPWIAADGTYKETPSKWGEAFFRDNSLKTGTVQPLEAW